MKISLKNIKSAAQMIRELYGHEYIEMVAMTVFASNEDKKKFLLDGFSYYISKPFLMHQIIHLVNEILNEKNVNKKIFEKNNVLKK